MPGRRRQSLTPRAVRSALAFFLLLGGLLSPGAMAQTRKSDKADRPQPAVAGKPAAVPANIDRNGVLILVRSALLALDQANKTGNYTVLRDLGAPGFQQRTAAQLGDIFASQRREGLDLGGAAVLDPQLTLLPQIEPNGMLHMAGFIPSLPVQVNFELMFAPVQRQWRLFGISLNLTDSTPKAPDVVPETPVAEASDPPIAPTPTVNPRRNKPPVEKAPAGRVPAERVPAERVPAEKPPTPGDRQAAPESLP